MSKEQLADLEAEKAAMPSNELADEMMIKTYEARFWKNRAWRAEQQRDREILARKAAEEKLERFKGLTQEDLEGLLLTHKKGELERVMAEAGKVIAVLLWAKYLKEAEGITDLDTRIKFWINLIAKAKEEE